MARQTVSLEWFIGEEYWRNERARNTPFPLDVDALGSVNERSLALILLRSATVIAAAILIISSMSPSPHQREYDRAFGAIQNVLHVEERAWKTNDRALFERITDPQVTSSWLGEWRDYWRTDRAERRAFATELLNVRVADGLIFATVRVARPAIDWWQTSPYEETRIYRQTATGWVRTVPAAEFWGEPRAVETPNLRFEFHARDEPMVEAVAPRIEATFQAIYQTLGVAIPVRTRKLTIRIAPTPHRGWSGFRNRIDLTVPLLARRSADTSESAHLERYLTSQMVSLTVSRFMNRTSSAYIYRWGVMAWAARGWLEAKQLGAPSPWYRQNEPVFLDYSRSQLPLALHDITRRRAKGEVVDPNRIYWQYLAAYSVIDYAVETYGHEQLPILLKGWGKHNTWDELIPALYNTSVAEFEAGWNQYLAEQYGW